MEDGAVSTRGVPWTDVASPNSHPSEQPNDCDVLYPATDVFRLSGGVLLRVPAVFETSMKCWLCDRELTKERDSKEHIVPAALGGRKTVKGFICKDCNSHKGRTWDAAVTEQLEFFAVLLNIKREGQVPHMNVKTVKGRRLFLKPGNKPVVAPTRPKEERVGDHIRVSMQRPNRTSLKKDIEGLMRRYPNAVVTELTSSEGKDYDKTPYEIDLSYGGPDFDRSVVKSALALTCRAGVRAEECDMAVRYLRNEQADYPDNQYLICYYDDPIGNRVSGLPLHCVHVVGDPVDGKLLAYVELYGHVRRIICLSDTYSAKQFSETYAIDPIIGKEIPEVAIRLNELRFNRIVRRQTAEVSYSVFTRAVQDVLSYGFELSQQRAFEEHFDRSMDECMRELNLSEDCDVTDDEKHRFVECLTNKLMPMIEYTVRPLDFPKGFFEQFRDAGRTEKESDRTVLETDRVVLTKKVGAVVVPLLEEHYQGRVKFNVEVTREYDRDEEPYLNIMIVFDGDLEELQTGWFSDFSLNIDDLLMEKADMSERTMTMIASKAEMEALRSNGS